jgi:hypothetical protein
VSGERVIDRPVCSRIKVQRVDSRIIIWDRDNTVSTDELMKPP